MNKLDFLRRLDRELSALDLNERRELLAFYEERFYTGTIYENKTEEEVIAELESPEVIARNILSEYGISVKERKVEKVKENNNSNNIATDTRSFNNINPAQLIWLIVIDVFVLSWALPSLFSVLTSFVGSLFTYIGVFGFLNGGTTYDIMIFWFLTGAYVLLFLFTLVILEFFIWAVKRTVLWHMKVLRFKKVNEWNKKLSKVSVEKWFKKHRFLRFVKNISGLAAVIVMAYTGLFLAASYDEINELYVEQEILTDVQTIDMSEYIDQGLPYSLVTDIDTMNVTVIKTTGTDIVITRKYQEDDDKTYSVDSSDDSQLTIIQEVSDRVFNFKLSIEDILSFMNRDELIVEIPEGLVLEQIDLNVLDGNVDLYDLEAEFVAFNGTNGSVYLSNISVTYGVDVQTTNGTITVIDSYGQEDLVLFTTNGNLIVRNLVFDGYDLDSTNGDINAEELNVLDKSGSAFDAMTTNGEIILSEVYCGMVELLTTNGDITYINEDTSFSVDLTRHTTNGSIETNVD
jgi:uncharacterized membrane protein